MTAKMETSPAAEPGKRSSRISRWMVPAAALAIAGVVGVIVYGYLARPGWIGVSGKKFWDYLELLIVPAALAIGVYWLNRRQVERDREAEDAQQRRELEIQEQRSQDEALQAYLDQLTSFLVTQQDQGLVRMQVDEDVRQVIQARSEPLLRSLSPARSWNLILFLSVMGLLMRDRPLVSLTGADLRAVDGRGAPIQGIDLQGANLSDANLSGADLSGADLTESDLSGADLSDANLHSTSLSSASLRDAYLSGADLSGAFLSRASLDATDLSGAILQEAELSWVYSHDATLSHANLRQAHCMKAFLARADLRDADLSGADLSGAHLSKASLSGANLRRADLSGAFLFMESEELERQVASLEGATMPNGQKYEDWRQKYVEDWLKDREKRQQDK